MREILLSARDRTALRRQVRLPCQVVTDEGFQLLATTCLDLSAQGMCVRARFAVPVGTQVIASFRVPDSSLYIDCDAEVTRVLWGRRQNEDATALGLRFLHLSRIDRLILASRLNGMPPPAPQRSLRIDYARTVLGIAHGLVPAHM